MSKHVRAGALLLACSMLSMAAGLHMRQTAFKATESGRPAGWTVWSARAEIAPKTFVDDIHYRSEPGSLAISGNSNGAAYGGWEYLVGGITAGKWYRFVAYYRTAGVQTESNQIVVRLAGPTIRIVSRRKASGRASPWMRRRRRKPRPSRLSCILGMLRKALFGGMTSRSKKFRRLAAGMSPSPR